MHHIINVLIGYQVCISVRFLDQFWEQTPVLHLVQLVRGTRRIFWGCNWWFYHTWILNGVHLLSFLSQLRHHNLFITILIVSSGKTDSVLVHGLKIVGCMRLLVVEAFTLCIIKWSNTLRESLKLISYTFLIDCLLILLSESVLWNALFSAIRVVIIAVLPGIKGVSALFFNWAVWVWKNLTLIYLIRRKGSKWRFLKRATTLLDILFVYKHLLRVFLIAKRSALLINGGIVLWRVKCCIMAELCRQSCPSPISVSCCTVLLIKTARPTCKPHQIQLSDMLFRIDCGFSF